MTDKRVDLAIGTTGAQPPAGINPARSANPDGRGTGHFSAPLGTIHFVFCIAPHHPLSQWPVDQPIPEDRLREHRAVVVADSSGTDRYTSAGVLAGQPSITVATLEQKIRAQVCGLGIGYIPESFARPWLDRGQLVRRQVESRRDPTDVFYAWSQALPGKALSWWLGRLGTPRVREKLLSGPAQ